MVENDSTGKPLLKVINPDVDISGRGGKEQIIVDKLFEGQLTRVHGEMYDAVDMNGIKYELKKQQNLQWFDPRKYAEFGKKTGLVKMLFIVWEKEIGVTLVASTYTWQFAERLFPDKLIDLAIQIKDISPKTQLKHPLYVKRYIEENTDTVDILYERK